MYVEQEAKKDRRALARAAAMQLRVAERTRLREAASVAPDHHASPIPPIYSSPLQPSTLSSVPPSTHHPLPPAPAERSHTPARELPALVSAVEPASREVMVFTAGSAVAGAGSAVQEVREKRKNNSGSSALIQPTPFTEILSTAVIHALPPGEELEAEGMTLSDIRNPSAYYQRNSHWARNTHKLKTPPRSDGMLRRDAAATVRSCLAGRTRCPTLKNLSTMWIEKLVSDYDPADWEKTLGKWVDDEYRCMFDALSSGQERKEGRDRDGGFLKPSEAVLQMNQ